MILTNGVNIIYRWDPQGQEKKQWSHILSESSSTSSRSRWGPRRSTGATSQYKNDDAVPKDVYCWLDFLTYQYPLENEELTYSVSNWPRKIIRVSLHQGLWYECLARFQDPDEAWEHFRGTWYWLRKESWPTPPRALSRGWQLVITGIAIVWVATNYHTELWILMLLQELCVIWYMITRKLWQPLSCCIWWPQSKHVTKTNWAELPVS